MEMKDEKKAKQIAEERMAIIAPLLNPGLDTAEIRRIRQQIAENGGPSERTVDRYLKHYLQDGFNGLMPEGKNPNAVYKIPESLVEEAIQLRRKINCLPIQLSTDESNRFNVRIVRCYIVISSYTITVIT